jgi:FkbM family methyltransferase
MNCREIVVHRFRDFESVLRAKKKLKLGIYVLLRQISKALGINEEKVNFLVEDNILTLKKNKFYTRKKTLDFLFMSRYYEPETTTFILNNKGKVMINVGSHIGRFSILSSKNYKEVYAIEPHPSNFSSLKKNLELNKIKNVRALNYAASDSEKSVFLGEIGINTGAVRINAKGNIKIKALPLDKILGKKVNRKDVDLMLIDVEGHELEVLNGSKSVLKNGSPKLIIESFNPGKIVGFLKKYGYEKKGLLDGYNHLFVKK